METVQEPPVKDIFYTPEEDDILTQNRVLRQQLVNLLVKDEGGKLVIPGKSADKILLDQLLNGVDKDVHMRAKLRIATKANDNLSDMRAMTAKLLLSHRNQARDTAPESARVLDDSFIPTDVVPGETSQGVETFSIDEFLPK